MALHHLELTSREQVKDQGMQFLQTVLPYMVHNSSHIQEYFKIESNLKKAKQSLKKKPFFSELIQKYLLNNNHKLTLIAEQDKSFIDEMI